MDEQYGKYMNNHKKTFEALGVHDIINTGFSVEYLYDKLIHKES